MISRTAVFRFLKFCLVTGACVLLISAVLFHHVPPEYVHKTVVAAARGLSASSEDIVYVYPSLLTLEDPVRFQPIHDGNTYAVTYTWAYDRQPYSLRVEIPEEQLAFYRNKTHERTDYEQYAVSEYDREIIQALADSFASHALRNKYSAEETALNVAAFVHTIPYTSDLETAGAEDYPRYPLETLVEGGDCEDRAILAAAILYEMDIECALIHLYDHVALGLKDNGQMTGQFYLHEDVAYYYIGMAGGETALGVVSSHIDPTLRRILPVKQKPLLGAELRPFLSEYEKDTCKYLLSGTIENAGSGHAQNVSLRILTQISGTASEEPVPDRLIPIGTISEDSVAEIEVDFVLPRANGYVTLCLEGENVDPTEFGGFYFNFARR